MPHCWISPSAGNDIWEGNTRAASPRTTSKRATSAQGRRAGAPFAASACSSEEMHCCSISAYRRTASSTGLSTALSSGGKSTPSCGRGGPGRAGPAGRSAGVVHGLCGARRAGLHECSRRQGLPSPREQAAPTGEPERAVAHRALGSLALEQAQALKREFGRPPLPQQKGDLKPAEEPAPEGAVRTCVPAVASASRSRSPAAKPSAAACACCRRSRGDSVPVKGRRVAAAHRLQVPMERF